MRAFMGEGDEDDPPPSIPDEIVLPRPLTTCVELWNAYKEHGIMPVSGGYFDQPRWWRGLIRVMNSVYNPLYKAHLDAMFPNSRSDDDDMKLYEMFGGDAGVRDGWDAFGQ